MKSFETGLAGRTIKVKDRRVNARKLENWKKRYRKDATAGEFLGSFNAAGRSSQLMKSRFRRFMFHSSWPRHIRSQSPKA